MVVALLIISHVQARILCDVISSFIDTFFCEFLTLFTEEGIEGRVMKGKRNHHGAVDKP